MADRWIAALCAAWIAMGTAQGQVPGPVPGQAPAPLPGQLPAPEPEVWEPTSTTAMAITGRITLAPDRITFANRASLPLEPAGEVPDFLADGQRVTATLYRVTEPGNPVLLRGGRLCSNGRPVRTIAVWQPPPIGNTAPGQGRSLAAFSGTALPKGAEDPGSCGTFQYEPPAAPRGRR
ncbi:hypothetical protein [Dankookia rubra]|uniref:hypothetical protein n=1 Tax=Dankookia rubra TaxID=1442381 RepID=UPI0014097D6B|nr:hypothetical protein [Dankookia rubra]